MPSRRPLRAPNSDRAGPSSPDPTRIDPTRIDPTWIDPSRIGTIRPGSCRSVGSAREVLRGAAASSLTSARAVWPAPEADSDSGPAPVFAKLCSDRAGTSESAASLDWRRMAPALQRATRRAQAPAAHPQVPAAAAGRAGRLGLDCRWERGFWEGSADARPRDRLAGPCPAPRSRHRSNPNGAAAAGQRWTAVTDSDAAPTGQPLPVSAGNSKPERLVRVYRVFTPAVQTQSTAKQRIWRRGFDSFQVCGDTLHARDRQPSLV